MKLLIFGIDGLGTESIDALRLTRLKTRMRNSKIGNPFIDNVVSRGWPELYTGLDAYRTGAFYQVPKMVNGKIEVNQNTGLSLVKDHIEENRILWNVLNGLGMKCGVFGIPTASTPDKIDGFFVAATGAGKFGNSLEKEDVYPQDLLHGLNLEEIDLGLRMGYGSYIPNDLKELEKKAHNHLSDFFHILKNLIERNEPQICFAVSRFINELSYKFIKLCIEYPQNKYEAKLKKLILNLAEHFDTLLNNFIKGLNPENLFIVSDHGIGLLKYHVNINEILFRCGYIKRDRKKNIIKRIANPARKIIFSKKKGFFYPGYCLNSSKCFSVGFTDLIYINDERFTGTFMNSEKLFYTSQEITERLNEYTKINNIDCAVWFEALDVAKYTNPAKLESSKVPLPNIRCHLSTGFTNTQRTIKHNVALNMCSFNPHLFREGFFGEYSGCKTEDTISFYEGNMKNLVHLDSLKDIYHSIITVGKEIS